MAHRSLAPDSRLSRPKAERRPLSSLSDFQMAASWRFLPSLNPSARAADPSWNAKMGAKEELKELERLENAYQESVRTTELCLSGRMASET